MAAVLARRSFEIGFVPKFVGSFVTLSTPKYRGTYVK